jgi:pyruvate kinase
VLQKTITSKANAVGKPVIIATQMLESMVHSPRPTRAETSDVANAILDGTDAVMLSAETAIGDYPVEAVQMMDRIARVAESSNPSIFGSHGLAQHSTTASIAHAAAALAHEGRVRAIVAITRSGLTAQLLSKLRPHEPLIAFTEQEAIVRRLGLWWGVQSFATSFKDNTDAMIAHLEDELLRHSLVEIGDMVTIVGSAPLVVRGRVNFVKMHRIRRPDA